MIEHRSPRPGVRIAGRRATPRRRGFSLVEVIVAIALFGITMSALAALTLTVGRQSVRGWETAQRTAALLARVNDMAVVPFAGKNFGVIVIGTSLGLWKLRRIANDPVSTTIGMTCMEW